MGLARLAYELGRKSVPSAMKLDRALNTASKDRYEKLVKWLSKNKHHYTAQQLDMLRETAKRRGKKFKPKKSHDFVSEAGKRAERYHATSPRAKTITTEIKSSDSPPLGAIVESGSEHHRRKLASVEGSGQHRKRKLTGFELDEFIARNAGKHGGRILPAKTLLKGEKAIANAIAKKLDIRLGHIPSRVGNAQRATLIQKGTQTEATKEQKREFARLYRKAVEQAERLKDRSNKTKLKRAWERQISNGTRKKPKLAGED